MASVSLTNYDSQVAELNRRQKLAELLQQQSSDPIQVFSSQHGIQAPIPWTAVLAKALQGGLSGYESKKAFEGQKALESSRRDEAKQFIQGLGGIGAQPMPVQTLPQTPDLQLAPNRPQPPGAVSPPPMQAPPPQPGYAEQPGTATTPMQDAQERQSRALQASVSGNPYLEKLAPTVYSEGEKDKERARVSSAIDDLPFDAAHKALIKQVAEFGGPQAAASAVNSLIKPVNETNEVKNYMFAKQNGYQKGFVDYQQDTNPNKFIAKFSEGQQGFVAGDILHPGEGNGGQPRALRNNNPLNLTVPASGPWAGQTGVDGKFAVFSSPEAGLAAADQNLQSYAKQGINTLQGIISKWAPPNENDTASYIKTVAQQTGINPNAPLNMADPRVRQQILASMAKVEIGGSSGGSPKPVVSIPPHVAASAAAWGLTPEETDAINKAVGEGRVDLKGLNSRTGKITADALMANPGMNAIQLHAVANVTSNPAYQQRAKALEALPGSLALVNDAGKKLNFSNIKALGGAQAWIRDQTNNPDFRNYMAKRNDALQRLAYAMRGVGMSDKAVEMEVKAAPEAMSPQAFDAWYKGQMEMVQNQIDQQAVFQVVGSGSPPAASPPPASGGGGGWGKAVVVRH